MIWRIKGDILHHHFASIGDIDTNVDKNDKLIQEVLTYKKAIYLNDLEDKKQTSYLYAIPFIDKNDTMVAILIIKDIPFLSYNEDTLLKINVVFNYIWTEYKKRASLDRITHNNQEIISIDNKHERQDVVDFKLEVIRLNNILNDYNIDSRIYAITTDNEYLDTEIKDFLYENELFEILDQYISLNCKNHYVHFLLFPLVSRPNLHDKIKDIDEKLEYIENQLRVTMLEDGLKSHLNVTNFERLNKKNISVKNFNALLEEYDCAG